MTKALILSNNLLKKWPFLIISLSLSGLACQTTIDQKSAAATNEAQILATQKELIRNNLDSGQPEMALKALRPMVRELPNDPSILNLMGLTQLALHNSTKAVGYFRQAYSLDKSASSALNLSSAYIDSGSPEKALTLLAGLLKHKVASDSYPYRERIFHNIGYAYIKLGQAQKGEKWLIEATEENPTFFPSHLELARLYEKTKKTAKAAKSYRRALDFCRVCFEPVKALANIHLQSGDPISARRILLQFTKVEGINHNDREQAEHLLKASATASLGGQRAG